MQKLRQFILFTLVGGLAAGVNIASRILLSHVASFEMAIIVAYSIGLITAFTLNRKFVFASAKTPAPIQFGRFLLVNVLAIVQVLLVSVVIARHLLPTAGIVTEADTLGHTIGVLSTVLTSFVLHKVFTFAERPPRRATAERST